MIWMSHSKWCLTHQRHWQQQSGSPQTCGLHASLWSVFPHVKLSLIFSAAPKKTKISFWRSRYQLPNLRRNKEWGRRSWGERAERNLLRLIQEGQMCAVATAPVSYWDDCWFKVQRSCGGNRCVCTSECQCGGMFYIARSEVRESGGRDGERNRLSEEGGAEKEVHIIDFWGATFPLTSSGLTSSGCSCPLHQIL